MNWLVFHIVSGQAFFSGVLLMIVAGFASTRKKPFARRVTVWGFILGAILIVISSTPIPYWYYAVSTTITLTWIVSQYVKKWRKKSAYAMMVSWAIAAVLEVPFHITPELDLAETPTLTIIGDSVTAGDGANDHAEKWPEILVRKYRLQIQDLSAMGDTVSSAHARLEDFPMLSSVILIEIGGNDLLSTTSISQFAEDLDALLEKVASPKRQVVMFELPLPPFHHEFGRIQRSLARKHDVLLIPKRVFLKVIATGDSTLDSIHLSQAGHQRMAKRVWEIIGSAFDVEN